METIEIINSFMKGSSKASISDKQKNWLISQAKKEGIPVGYNGWDDLIYFDDCYFSIRHSKRLASGGSYVGSRIIQGRFNIEKLYRIRFTEGSKHTAVYGQVDIDHFRRENIGFEIIKPTVNTSTR